MKWRIQKNGAGNWEATSPSGWHYVFCSFAECVIMIGWGYPIFCRVYRA
jgi:hypothetical protein